MEVDVPGRPVPLRYRPEDEDVSRAGENVVGALLGSAERRFRAALARQGVEIDLEGPEPVDLAGVWTVDRRRDPGRERGGEGPSCDLPAGESGKRLSEEACTRSASSTTPCPKLPPTVEKSRARPRAGPGVEAADAA